VTIARWAPWLAAFIVWNGAFDLQVRRAGEAFTADQTERWRQQQPPVLLRDAFIPEVRKAAVAASGAAGVVLLAGLAWSRRAARGAHR
jgi:hypothetical protein